MDIHIGQGYWEFRKHLPKHTRAKQNAKEDNKNGMRNLTNVSENKNIVNWEDTAVSRSFQPRSPSGVWRLHTKYRGYFGK
eukprot:4411061-Pleurochrysis_carterae.AAC.1